MYDTFNEIIPGSTPWMKNFPSKSVAAPFAVPLIMTFAPIKASLLSKSSITPVMLPNSFAKMLSQHNKSNNILIFNFSMFTSQNLENN